jgi:hypothetical protein
MTSTSAGSRPDPKQFLEGKVDELYAQQKEKEISDLQNARTPGVGQQALTGAVPQTIREAYESGVLRV